MNEGDYKIKKMDNEKYATQFLPKPTWVLESLHTSHNNDICEGTRHCVWFD